MKVIMIDTPTLTGVYSGLPPQSIDEAIPRDTMLAKKAWIWIEEELKKSGKKFKTQIRVNNLCFKIIS